MDVCHQSLVVADDDVIVRERASRWQELQREGW
jgi:hypothetical protein